MCIPDKRTYANRFRKGVKQPCRKSERHIIINIKLTRKDHIQAEGGGVTMTVVAATIQRGTSQIVPIEK